MASQQKASARGRKRKGDPIRAAEDLIAFACNLFEPHWDLNGSAGNKKAKIKEMVNHVLNEADIFKNVDTTDIIARVGARHKLLKSRGTKLPGSMAAEYGPDPAQFPVSKVEVADLRMVITDYSNDAKSFITVYSIDPKHHDDEVSAILNSILSDETRGIDPSDKLRNRQALKLLASDDNVNSVHAFLLRLQSIWVGMFLKFRDDALLDAIKESAVTVLLVEFSVTWESVLSSKTYLIGMWQALLEILQMRDTNAKTDALRKCELYWLSEQFAKELLIEVYDSERVVDRRVEVKLVNPESTEVEAKFLAHMVGMMLDDRMWTEQRKRDSIGGTTVVKPSIREEEAVSPFLMSEVVRLYYVCGFLFFSLKSQVRHLYKDRESTLRVTEQLLDSWELTRDEVAGMQNKHLELDSSDSSWDARVSRGVVHILKRNWNKDAGRGCKGLLFPNRILYQMIYRFEQIFRHAVPLTHILFDVGEASLIGEARLSLINDNTIKDLLFRLRGDGAVDSNELREILRILVESFIKMKTRAYGNRFTAAAGDAMGSGKGSNSLRGGMNR
jgi:hypothetical protein